MGIKKIVYRRGCNAILALPDSTPSGTRLLPPPKDIVRGSKGPLPSELGWTGNLHSGKGGQTMTLAHPL